MKYSKQAMYEEKRLTCPMALEVTVQNQKGPSVSAPAMEGDGEPTEHRETRAGLAFCKRFSQELPSEGTPPGTYASPIRLNP